MYRRDYFLKLTQQFAKVLARLLGLKEKGDMEQALQVIHEAYKEMLGMNWEEIGKGDSVEFIKWIRQDSLLKNEQLEILAKLMYEEAEISSPGIREDLFRKALSLLEYLNGEQKIYSFEREEMIQKIKKNI